MPATRAALHADFLIAHATGSRWRVCLLNGAWRASLAQAVANLSRHGTREPAKLSGCVVGVIVSDGTGVAKPCCEDPFTANREPNSARFLLAKETPAPHLPSRWRNRVRSMHRLLSRSGAITEVTAELAQTLKLSALAVKGD